MLPAIVNLYHGAPINILRQDILVSIRSKWAT